MTESDSESILVNLKILASLEIGQKLVTTDKTTTKMDVKNK